MFNEIEIFIGIGLMLHITELARVRADIQNPHDFFKKNPELAYWVTGHVWSSLLGVQIFLDWAGFCVKYESPSDKLVIVVG